MQMIPLRFDLAGRLREALLGSDSPPTALLLKRLDFVTQLVAELLFLHEEGRELRPAILLSETRDATARFVNLSEQDLMNTIVDNVEIHDLTITPPRGEVGVKQIVKSALGLSLGPWLPCIEFDPDTRLGLIRYPHRLIFTMAEAAANHVNHDTVLLKKVHDGAVRLHAGGVTFEIVANPSARVRQPNEHAEALVRFTDALCLDRNMTRTIYWRLRAVIQTVLENSHGALLAIVRPGPRQGSCRLSRHLSAASPFSRGRDGVC